MALTGHGPRAIEVPDPNPTYIVTTDPIYLLYKRGPTTLGCIA